MDKVGRNRRVYIFFLIFTMFIFYSQDCLGGVTYQSSISVGDGGPLRIATDREGRIYVTTQDIYSARVWEFDSSGNFSGYIDDFKRPVGIAVDRSGKVYVGSYKKGSIGVYDRGGRFLYYLGQGEGEFGHPNDIATDSRGYVYVSDSTNNLVKVYSSDGTFQFSIGGYGSADGQMNFPTGITIDEYAQELYVVDHLNIRIEVFDLNGNFKRKFTSSYLLRPQGIAVSNGKVYVVDIYHSSVKVFDTNGNYITSIGVYGPGAGEFILPVDVAISNGKMLVTDSGNQRIQVFDLNEPGLVITPITLSFVAHENSTPQAQTIQIDADSSGAAQWTAIVEAPFPVTLSATSGGTPSSITVSIDTTGMTKGTYNGKLYLYADGTEYPVNINLTIKEIPNLVVSPSTVVLIYAKGGTLPSTVLNITTSESVSWTAQTDSVWIDLSALSGTTPATVTVSVNSTVATYASGTYSGSITVTAPDAKNSPVTVPVTLQIISGGSITVKTNLDEATFEIRGPENYSGSGRSWTAYDVPPGTYTITFGDVSNYKTPGSTTFTIEPGKNITIEALYEVERLANTIIAGKGPDPRNDGKVRLFDLSGNLLGEIEALTTTYGANVATADLDGDLSDEIIAGAGIDSSNRATISILKPEGTILATTTIANTSGGAYLATGDIDGDGIPEIAVSTITNNRKKTYIVEIYSYSNGSLNRKASVYASSVQGNKNEPLPLTLVDLKGDGTAELVVFESGYIKVFGFNRNLTTYLIASKAITQIGNRNRAIKEASLTAGDINGDGRPEILVGYLNEEGDAIIRAYNANLTEIGLNIMVFKGGNAAPSISAMDIDGDGIVEVLAGKGASLSNDALIRIIRVDGTVLKEIKAFNTTYGVKGAFGFIKR